jgi:hypothetical protein
MASFRSLLMGMQTDKEQAALDKAVTSPPPTPAAGAKPVEQPAPFTGSEAEMKSDIKIAPGGIPRLVAARVARQLALNPEDDKELRGLFDKNLPKQEFNAQAKPIFDRLKILTFPTANVDPYEYFKANALPTTTGGRAYREDLNEDVRQGQIDTDELVNRGLSATSESVIPNVYKPVQKVSTGGRSEGNRPQMMGGMSSRSGMLDMDTFIERAMPRIEELSKISGRPIDAISEDIKTRISDARTAPAKKSSAYDVALQAITKDYSKPGTAGTEDAGKVGGAQVFTGEIPDFSNANQRNAFAAVVGRQIGARSPGAYLGQLLQMDATKRINAVTNAALESGIPKSDATGMGRFVESVAKIYGTASGTNRTAIASGFTKLIELTTALDNPSLGVPDNVKSDVFKQASMSFEAMIRKAGSYGESSEITSKRLGVDSLANLTDRGMVSFLLSGRPYSEWLTTSKRVVGADKQEWRDEGKVSVKDVEGNVVSQTLSAARGIALDRFDKAFDSKYAGTPIGEKKDLVIELMTELFKKTDIPLISRLEDGIKTAAKDLQLGKEIGSGNTRASTFFDAIKTGAQIGKDGPVIDPVTGKAVSGPAQALAARLNVTNLISDAMVFDWRGIGQTDFDNPLAKEFPTRIRKAIDALKANDYGEFAFQVEPYVTPDKLEVFLPARVTEQNVRGVLPAGEDTGVPYRRNEILRDSIVRNLQRVTGADIKFKVGGREFATIKDANDYITTERNKIASSKLYAPDKVREMQNKLFAIPMLQGGSTNKQLELFDVFTGLQTPQSTEHVNRAFAKILKKNPDYVNQFGSTKPSFADKVMAVGADSEIGTLRFWQDFVKFTPKASAVFGAMRGAGVKTKVNAEGLPERLQQNRDLINVQSDLVKRINSSQERVKLPDALLTFVTEYKRFGINPYSIESDGTTKTGFSPEGLTEKIKQNPEAWSSFINAAGDIARAYQGEALDGKYLGNSVRAAVQGANARRTAGKLQYSPKSEDVDVQKIIQILVKVPDQTKALLGRGQTTNAVAGGLTEGLRRIEELVSGEKITSEMLSGKLLGVRSQYLPEKDLFSLANSAIDTMARAFGPYDDRLRYYAPEFAKKAAVIEKSGQSQEIKDARLQDEFDKLLADPMRYKGVLSKLSGPNGLEQVRRVRKYVGQAEEANIGRKPAESRGSQKPTEDAALRRIEQGSSGKSKETKIGDVGPNYKPVDKTPVPTNYVPQQFMGELTPEKWVESITTKIDQWNISNPKPKQINANDQRIIKLVADELASGRTIDQLQNSPRFEGKDLSALNMALDFLRFSPGSRFDLSALRGSAIADASPALPASKPVKALSAPADDAGKPKGGRAGGLLGNIKKFGMGAVAAPVLTEIYNRGQSNLSQQIRNGNAAKK